LFAEAGIYLWKMMQNERKKERKKERKRKKERRKKEKKNYSLMQVNYNSQ
jgi:hypothetical protein